MLSRPAVVPGWALAPAALYLLVLPTNHTMALRMIFLFTALGVALWSLRRQPMPALPIRWALAAWLGLALLSLTWSAQPAFSLAEIKTEIGYGLASFFVFFILTHGRRELRLWMHVAIAALALTLVLAVVGYARTRPGVYHWDIVHGYASYGTYLATAAPLLIAWLITLDGRRRIAGALVLGLYLAVAYLLGNRMFWLSLTAVLVIFAIFAARRPPFGRPRAPLVAALVAGVALAATLFVVVANQKPADYTRTERSESVSTHVADTFSKSERIYLWAFWIERIRERPLTGVGFGRDLPHWVHEKPKEWPDLYFAHAHNLILDYGAQLGVPGILAILWLFAAIAHQFWRIARQADACRSLAGVAGLGLVVAVFSKNMTDELFWRTDALVFWSFAGALLGYGLRAPPPRDPQ